MKAMVLTDLGKMESREVQLPRIQRDTDVLLKIAKVGVCGSDVHYYETGRIGSLVVEYPFRVGHECAGTVVEIGSSVTRVKPGDEVAVEPAMYCYECDQCRCGRENTCRNLRFLGCPGQAEGALCEYLVLPQDCCFPLKGRINLEQAVLCEPLSVGVYAVRQSTMAENSEIAILGAGPIGHSVLIAARHQGVGAVYMTDIIEERVDLARNKADWAGNPKKEDIVKAILEQQPAGMDVVFECCGQQEALDESLELLKPGGKLMLIGIPREDRISFRIDLMRRREITVINVRRQNNCVEPSIDIIASGKVDVDYMVTHRFDFAQTREAFEMVAHYRDGVIKAMIDISG